MNANRRLALLIDGDNAQAALLDQMLTEMSKYGIVTIRRVYGDWSKPHLASWKEVVHAYALQTEHQFNNIPGKNATDFALVIDAMDILHSGEVDGFCILSSDSDYTPLAMRIREQNLFVMGIGKSNTPPAFVTACHIFVYTENLGAQPKVEKAKKTPVPDVKTPVKAATNKAATKSVTTSPPLEIFFRKAFAETPQNDGWVGLAAIGSTLRRLDPTFDYGTYGYTNLSSLVRAHPKIFKMREVQTNDGTQSISIRLNATNQTPK